MSPFSTLLPVLIVLIHPPPTRAAFFSGHGYFNNSCPVRACETCGVGQYRLGCANASGGVCTNCTRVPNATFTSHGWFNNSCNFTCNAGFAFVQGRSCERVVTRFTIDSNWTAIVAANVSFNMTTYIRAFAVTSGCGACGNVSNNPVKCGDCMITYSYTTSVDIVYRRLLSSANKVDVNTVITIDDNKALAESAASSITKEALVTELAKSNIKYDSLSLAAPPVVITRVIIVAPPPAPPPVPPPVPPPPPPPSEDSGSNIGAIAGGVVGGVLGLALIVVLVVVLTRQKAQVAASPVTGSENEVPEVKSTKSMFRFKQVKKQDMPKLASKFVYVRRT